MTATPPISILIKKALSLSLWAPETLQLQYRFHFPMWFLTWLPVCYHSNPTLAHLLTDQRNQLLRRERLSVPIQLLNPSPITMSCMKFGSKLSSSLRRPSILKLYLIDFWDSSCSLFESFRSGAYLMQFCATSCFLFTTSPLFDSACRFIQNCAARWKNGIFCAFPQFNLFFSGAGSWRMMMLLLHPRLTWRTTPMKPSPNPLPYWM